jgi:5'-3' exonuclease
MGISGLLPRILPSAGRENYDLRALSDGLLIANDNDDDDDRDRTDEDDYDDEEEDEEGRGDEEPKNNSKRKKRRRIHRRRSSSSSYYTRRRVRIAVDVSGWIARAAHGHGGLLMDERHLSYRGRAELRDERTTMRMRDDGGDGHDDDPTAYGNDVDVVEENERESRRRLEYVSACTSTVLRRIEFLMDDCGSSVLLVLDGATPPCKRDIVRARSARRIDAAEERDGPVAMAAGEVETTRDDEATRTESEVLRRISASNRAGTGGDYELRRDMVRVLLGVCRERDWPYVVAPYEADGQLAYLAGCGCVDVVVTEDSDLIALGVPTLIYKMGGWNGSSDANRRHGDERRLLGTMLCRSDLGSSRGIDLRDFTDGMLATMFVAAGCDYCESLLGIGIVTARNVVKRAYHGCESDGTESYRRAYPEIPVLRVVLDELFRSCHRRARVRVLPLDDPEKEDARSAYERAFLAALAMFRHPLVYDPISRCHVVANDVSSVDGGNPAVDGTRSSFPPSALFLMDERILMEYGPYRDLVTRRDALYRVIGSPLDPKLARDVAEGLVDPRRLPEWDSGGVDASVAAAHQGVGDMVAARENDPNHDDEDDGAESGECTRGSSGLQLSTQEDSRADNQESVRSSSGMISSLSPDLLMSPSPPKKS